MKLYRVIHDQRVEAKSAQDAESIHLENNGSAVPEYFVNKEEAFDRFHFLSDDLYPPKPLSYGRSWFDCVSIEWADCRDPEDVDTMYDVFCEGENFCAEINVGKEETHKYLFEVSSDENYCSAVYMDPIGDYIEAASPEAAYELGMDWLQDHDADENEYTCVRVQDIETGTYTEF